MIFTPELASLALGSLGGFILKYLSIRAQDEKDKFDRMMQSIDKADQSANLASQRVPNDRNGNIIRRIIVLCVLFGVILGPFILSIMGKTTIVEVVTPVREYLFGLLTLGGHTKFYELPSYLISETTKQGLLFILGFYFGNGAAKRT